MHAVESRSAVETTAAFEEVVGDATLAMNVTPKRPWCESPFYILFGQDMCLPGFGQIHEHPSEENRKATVRELRLRGMARSQIVEEEWQELQQNNVVTEGDIVLYKLNEYERVNHYGHPSSTAMRFVPTYSSPCRVITKHEKGVVVRELFRRDGPGRQVPYSQVKKFSPIIPASLAKIALKELCCEHPRFAAIKDRTDENVDVDIAKIIEDGKKEEERNG
eukprot:GHVO01052266.1.p1 GENE.GHVO01052266.1~~GHVO01052266.1.p1  ORF type:complete len:220 (+),score=21.28 GHVO01052266.1:191-850(+)